MACTVLTAKWERLKIDSRVEDWNIFNAQGELALLRRTLEVVIMSDETNMKLRRALNHFSMILSC